ncbi:SAM-dependent methyltransferase [Trebonia sp.]|uniref:SAM-dependent methyltransferase n=1 Tax=Trebonia sp. TaxID=2767075 RepID=UPI002602D461|nr:SAM-dependent methyltransferase [Trebonia sp.]
MAADGPEGGVSRGLDTSVAHPARVYDYWLGGKDNFAADRAAAEAAMAANPLIVPGVRANRAFLVRAVRFLAGEVGIRQFLDIGTGLPSADNTHEVAQAIAPQCRIVYVDNDPIVLRHAEVLLTSTQEGATTYVEADARDLDAIVRQAAQTLDFGRPVAVMLLAILQNIADSDDPHQVVARLMSALVPGSWLVLSHPASDIHPEIMAEMASRLNDRQRAAEYVRFRTREEISRFFDGLELVEPGVVQLHRWRPAPGDYVPDHEITAWCGVARKR